MNPRRHERRQTVPGGSEMRRACRPTDVRGQDVREVERSLARLAVAWTALVDAGEVRPADADPHAVRCIVDLGDYWSMLEVSGAWRSWGYGSFADALRRRHGVSLPEVRRVMALARRLRQDGVV